MSDRQAALDMALKQIEKQFGKGSIMKLGEQAERRVSTVSSGSLALDVALGVGGYPRGRIIEIYNLRVQVKQQFHYMQLQRYSAKVDKRHSLMRSMQWILYMHKN